MNEKRICGVTFLHSVRRDVLIFCLFFMFEEEKKEKAESYVAVIPDTKHKVTDHYNVHEKLGV